MQFEKRQFSHRYPKIKCAVFVISEPDPHSKFSINGSAHRGTAAAIILPDGRFWTGVTLCSPQDQFIKQVGRAKAIGRAFQALISNPNDGDWLDHHGTISELIRDDMKIQDFLKITMKEMKRKMNIADGVPLPFMVVCCKCFHRGRPHSVFFCRKCGHRICMNCK